MRYIVLGDVHGNYYALKDVIMDALYTYGNEIDGFIFTGDYIGEFPDGDKVIDLIRQLSLKNKVHIISGNRETGQACKYLESIKQTGKEPNWDLDTTMGAALVSCRGLKRDQLEYLKYLPDYCIISKAGMRPIFIQHKMPLSPRNIKLVRDEKMVVISAHTHEAHIGVTDKYGVTVFNPGSVGLPDEGVKGAIYSVMESCINEKGESDWKFTDREIDYDYQSTINSLKSNHDLYERCCGWGKALELSILTGVNCTVLYGFEAKRLALEEQRAKESGEEPDFSPKIDINEFFSQCRYGNVDYDGSVLQDRNINYIDGTWVFGLADVITVGNDQVKTPPISAEMYKKAFENVKYMVSTFNINRETVFAGRHREILESEKKNETEDEDKQVGLG